MNKVHCYRLLGLSSTAGLEEIKASYRRLARQYHPDFNQGNPQAQNHFIRLTEAYQFLKDLFPDPEFKLPTPPQAPLSSRKKYGSNYRQKSAPNSPHTPYKQPFSKVNYQKNPDQEQKLKWQCYEKLREVMKEKRFARAIALVEGLSYRLPLDLEVCQWKAIVYQYQARQLLEEKQLEKAKIYFKKALLTDPHNQILVSQIQQDLAKLTMPC